MNTLSILASFGALVWIFQDGNLSALLGFTPPGLCRDDDARDPVLRPVRVVHGLRGVPAHSHEGGLGSDGRQPRGRGEWAWSAAAGSSPARPPSWSSWRVPSHSRTWCSSRRWASVWRSPWPSMRPSSGRSWCPRRCGSWDAGTGGCRSACSAGWVGGPGMRRAGGPAWRSWGLALVVVGCGGPILANPVVTAPPIVRPAATPTRAPDPQPVELPRDDAPHDRLTEWWYDTGHLVAQDGRRSASRWSSSAPSVATSRSRGHRTWPSRMRTATGSCTTSDRRSAPRWTVSTGVRVRSRHPGEAVMGVSDARQTRGPWRASLGRDHLSGTGTTMDGEPFGLDLALDARDCRQHCTTRMATSTSDRRVARTTTHARGWTRQGR